MNIPDSATHKYARVFYKLVGDIWYAWTDGGWHVSRLGAEVLDSGARKLSAPVPPQADAQFRACSKCGDAYSCSVDGCQFGAAGESKADAQPVAYLCNGGTRVLLAKDKQEAVWNAGRPLYTHAALAEGDCTPEALWGGSRHTCPKCFGAGSTPKRLPGEGETEYRARCKTAATVPPQADAQPVALPARKDGNGPLLSNHRSYNQGWNACLEAIANLGPLFTHADAQPVTPIGYVHQWELDRIAAGYAHWATLWDTEETNNPSRTGPVQALYTHADAGEVEKWKERCQYNADTAHALAEELDALRGEVERLRKELIGRNAQVVGLRAKLAEQDALLEHAVGAIDGEDWEWLLTRIRAALSASAEPGADHDN